MFIWQTVKLFLGVGAAKYAARILQKAQSQNVTIQKVVTVTMTRKNTVPLNLNGATNLYGDCKNYFSGQDLVLAFFIFKIYAACQFY
jgi:hypothetical protein